MLIVPNRLADGTAKILTKSLAQDIVCKVGESKRPTNVPIVATHPRRSESTRSRTMHIVFMVAWSPEVELSFKHCLSQTWPASVALEAAS
jgi:hypothetical protein